MSVIANKRGLSSMQFYKTAMNLSRDITKDLLAKLLEQHKIGFNDIRYSYQS